MPCFAHGVAYSHLYVHEVTESNTFTWWSILEVILPLLDHYSLQGSSRFGIVTFAQRLWKIGGDVKCSASLK